MRKIVLTFGLIAGAVMSATLALSVPFHEQIGLDRGAVLGYTSMVLAFLMIYFGVRTYRDSVAGGSVSFGQAFKVGLLIMVVASACYVITWEIIYFNWGEGFTETYTAHVLDKMRAGGATEAAVAAKQAEIAKFVVLYQNPLFNAAITFLEPLPVGLLFTVLSAWGLSRKPRPAGAMATA